MSLSSNSARCTVTFAAGDLDDDNGVKTSAATATSATALTGADYDGAAVSSSAWVKLPRSVTITLSSSVGSYSTDAIVLTGTRDGIAATESLSPSSADGNETLRGSQVFDAPPGIVIPAQVDTSGAIEIGCGNIGTPSSYDRFSALRLAADGQANVQYGTSESDSFAAIADAIQPVRPSVILTSGDLTTPTAVGLTVFMD